MVALPGSAPRLFLGKRSQEKEIIERELAEIAGEFQALAQGGVPIPAGTEKPCGMVALGDMGGNGCTWRFERAFETRQHHNVNDLNDLNDPN